MTLSIKKKNGSKTRKRILKSRKNILRGGLRIGPFGKKSKAPHPVSEPAPAPKRVVRSVLSSISSPTKGISNLPPKVSKVFDNGVSVIKSTVASILAPPPKQNSMAKFQALLKKVSEEQTAKEAAAGITPPKTSMSDHMNGDLR